MSQSGQSSRERSGTGSAVFTVDLEEYFEVKVLREFVPPAEWDSLPARADRAVDTLLGYLSRHGARATFFVSPWVAESRPLVVRRIASVGHEVAVLVRTPGSAESAEERRDAWRRVVRESRDRLEQLTGRRVLGCRSTRFRHALPAEEAIDILAEEGFRYDSTLSLGVIRSVFDGDVSSGATLRLPPPDGPLLAVPPSTVNAFGRRLFTVGRTAFRVLPYSMTRRALSRDAGRGHGGVFSMRSWEVDPVQPTLPVSLASRVRLYWGLHRVPSRLELLLREHTFDSAAGALGLETAEASDRADGRGPEGEERSRRWVRRMHG